MKELIKVRLSIFLGDFQFTTENVEIVEETETAFYYIKNDIKYIVLKSNLNTFVEDKLVDSLRSYHRIGYFTKNELKKEAIVKYFKNAEKHFKLYEDSAQKSLKGIEEAKKIIEE